MNTQDSQSEIEGILIARVKVIGDNEWTVLGYPDELIKEIEAYVTTRVKEALQDVLNEYAKQYQKHLLDMGRSGKTPFTIFHKIINTQYKALTTTTNGKGE